jgi:hypothetical protein
MLLIITVVGLLGLLVWNGRAICAYLCERRRRNQLGNALFGQPPLPLIGNLLELPRNSYGILLSYLFLSIIKYNFIKKNLGKNTGNMCHIFTQKIKI